MSTSTLTADLEQFTGTAAYHALSVLFPRVVISDGAKYLAEKAGAFWLLEAIASYQPEIGKAPHADMLKQMQFWKLKVNADKSCVLTCVPDSGYAPSITQNISCTDFPLSEITLYCSPTEWLSNNGPVTGVLIYLPSEY